MTEAAAEMHLERGFPMLLENLKYQLIILIFVHDAIADFIFP